MQSLKIYTFKLLFVGIILALPLFLATACITIEYQTPEASLATATSTRQVESASPTSEPSTPAATPVPTAEPSSTPTLTPLPTEGPTDTPQNPPQAIINELLNVRSGPGTDYARVGKLQPGAMVIISGKNGDGTWWQIVYPDTETGNGWIAAAYAAAQNTETVPVIAELPPTPLLVPPTATPASAAAPATAIPAAPDSAPFDFVVQSVRLWSNEENGGISRDGAVTNCGEGHNIFVTVLDAFGKPLDGMVISDTYGNSSQITGSIGPGRAEFLIYNGNGWELFVKEDTTNGGQPVTSEISPVLSGKFFEIPIPWLMEAHYCADVEACRIRIEQEPMVCFSHFSYDITFRRAW